MRASLNCELFYVEESLSKLIAYSAWKCSLLRLPINLTSSLGNSTCLLIYVRKHYTELADCPPGQDLASEQIFKPIVPLVANDLTHDKCVLELLLASRFVLRMGKVFQPSWVQLCDCSYFQTYHAVESLCRLSDMMSPNRCRFLWTTYQYCKTWSPQTRFRCSELQKKSRSFL